METSQELSATSILSLFQTTKEERISFAQSVLTSLRAGDKNPMDVHLQIKCMEELITVLTSTDEKKNKNPEIAKEYKEILLAESIKQMGGAKSTVYHNARFEIKEVGTQYDFTNCGDPEYIKLQAEFEKAKKALGDRGDFLKKAPVAGFESLDKGSGELITIYPPSKSSTTSVAVSLK